MLLFSPFEGTPSCTGVIPNKPTFAKSSESIQKCSVLNVPKSGLHSNKRQLPIKTTQTYIKHTHTNTQQLHDKLKTSSQYKQPINQNIALSLVSFNCRSIRNKVHHIMNYLKDNKIGIGCLQETWLNQCDRSVYRIIEEYGYKFFTQERRDARGGGVAVLYEPKLEMQKVFLNKTKSYESFEYICCRLSLCQNCIIIINIYRPPYSSRNKCIVKTFYNEF